MEMSWLQKKTQRTFVGLGDPQQRNAFDMQICTAARYTHEIEIVSRG